MKQTNNVPERERLTPEIKDLLLSRHSRMGQLADIMKVSYQTIKRQLESDSEQLCLSRYLDAIRKILGVGDITLTERYYLIVEPITD